MTMRWPVVELILMGIGCGRRRGSPFCQVRVTGRSKQVEFARNPQRTSLPTPPSRIAITPMVQRLLEVSLAKWNLQEETARASRGEATTRLLGGRAFELVCQILQTWHEAMIINGNSVSAQTNQIWSHGRLGKILLRIRSALHGVRHG
jgi:hypothetical protein